MSGQFKDRLTEYASTRFGDEIKEMMRGSGAGYVKIPQEDIPEIVGAEESIKSFVHLAHTYDLVAKSTAFELIAFGVFGGRFKTHHARYIHLWTHYDQIKFQYLQSNVVLEANNIDELDHFMMYLCASPTIYGTPPAGDGAIAGAGGGTDAPPPSYSLYPYSLSMEVMNQHLLKIKAMIKASQVVKSFQTVPFKELLVSHRIHYHMLQNDWFPELNQQATNILSDGLSEVVKAVDTMKLYLSDGHTFDEATRTLVFRTIAFGVYNDFKAPFEQNQTTNANVEVMHNLLRVIQADSLSFGNPIDGYPQSKPQLIVEQLPPQPSPSPSAPPTPPTTTQSTSPDSSAPAQTQAPAPTPNVHTKQWPAESNYVRSYTEVIELNKHNFDRAIEENDFVFVLFYAPWCARSQSLYHEVDEARRLYNYTDIPVLFARVNCASNLELRDKQSIAGYPVIQLYRRYGGNVIPRGPTHPDNLAATIRAATFAPITLLLDKDDLDDYMWSMPHAIYGVFPNNATPEYHKFQFISDRLAYRVPIALINDTSLAQIMFESIDQPPPYQGIIHAIASEGVYELNRCHDDPAQIFRWMTQTQPAVFELSPESLHRFATALPNIVLFINYTEYSTNVLVENKTYSPELMTLYDTMDEFRQTFRFFYADAEMTRDFADKLGITTLPGLAIIDVQAEEHYLFPTSEDMPIDIVNLLQFMNDYQLSKLTPYRRSDSLLPSSRPGANHVIKAVYDSFEDDVIKSNRLSLVYFYVPWCGFCKTMGIHFAEAARQLSEQRLDVDVLDYDCSTNSLPNMLRHSIDEYPYIALFPSENPHQPIVYNGSRSVESIINFVKKVIHVEQNRNNDIIDMRINSLDLAGQVLDV
ncbi:hypothetical protein SAMD00019534_082540 [Acytostelium subglobosum LB1]|uniref:hypothetical protein n=1 Tax=Acytostelium subglobosum LB1 TaxID=1410327 RepID=UPI0006448B93|nr:hypothetical protein SAMD00019534_082540 [Acytostelium subglobosum LB1]GAM25079.1 hypothetical protein SAMD00019534_082540 [Acytostelium subglobosum LB1]|eukprot:XP_012752168.1 hypothetical protein SAMD00019534_082540 [Acytostelium subglobosum LB1]